MVLALASAPVASAEDGHKSSYSQFGGNLLTGGNAPYLDLSQSPSPQRCNWLITSETKRAASSSPL